MDDDKLLFTTTEGKFGIVDWNTVRPFSWISSLLLFEAFPFLGEHPRFSAVSSATHDLRL